MDSFRRSAHNAGMELALVVLAISTEGLLQALLHLLIVGIVLAIVYFVASKFVQGTILQLIGLLCVVILLIYGLRLFGIV